MKDELSIAAAELSPIVGERCAALVLSEVRSIREGRIGWRRGFDKPNAAQRDQMAAIAEHAAELAKLLRVDSVPSRLVAAGAELGAAYGDPGRIAMLGRSDAIEEVRRIASDLNDLAAWAADVRDRPIHRGPPPDELRAYALAHLALHLSMHGHSLAAGENSKLVRVARICWPLFGFNGDARDALRRAIKSGSLDLAWYEGFGHAEGGEFSQASAEPAPGGVKTKMKTKRAP